MTTLLFGDYQSGTGRLRYASAGHLPALLVAHAGPQYLEEGRSLPLGIEAGSRAQAQLTVPDGALLLCYTDGLIERRHESLDGGLARLKVVAAQLTTVDRACDQIVDHLTQGQDLQDDVVLICLRFGEPISAEETPMSEDAVHTATP